MEFTNLLTNKSPGKTGEYPVPKVGVEPTWAEAHYALNVARLPIPPLRHRRYFTFKHLFVNLPDFLQLSLSNPINFPLTVL